MNEHTPRAQSMRSRWLHQCHSKILRHKVQRGTGKCSAIMEQLATDFESVGASPEFRRLVLREYLDLLDSYLDASGITSRMPKAVIRRLYDIEIGKVDPVFRARRGGSNYTLDVYELQRRALLASKAIRRVRKNYTEREGDEWVWERIKEVVPYIFARALPTSNGLDHWRRGLRRTAQDPTRLEAHWARVNFKSPGAPDPLWRAVKQLRTLGGSWEEVAEQLLQPFADAGKAYDTRSGETREADSMFRRAFMKTIIGLVDEIKMGKAPAGRPEAAEAIMHAVDRGEADPLTMTALTLKFLQPNVDVGLWLEHRELAAHQNNDGGRDRATRQTGPS